MKNTLKLVAFVVLLSVVVTSCKKYPEGPSLSLRTKKARLAGDWVIENIKVNGSDVTSFYAALSPNYSLTMTKDGNYTVSDNSGELDKGTWKFDDKKENIISTSTKNTSQAAKTTKILKLENDALWTTETSNGNTTETHYKAK